ncbi:MAG: DUF1624 domain-containing protein [Archaeoglobales archaeon]|nr:MAG: DUF1624 domain-containing protein [Archaeoglobales archaeon]
MRFWEIDFLRGFGIILMLISNFVTDLQIFLNYPSNQFWDLFAKFTASIFVFVSGVSFYVSYTTRNDFKKILRRFVKLMSLGILITITTALTLKIGTIYFGILHFLSLAWILAIPFYRFGSFAILPALMFILTHPIVDSIHIDNLALLPLGITPNNFYTFDYFPIFPWFGVFLIGFPFGKLLCKKKPSSSDIPIIRLICYIGRNSLKIYLIHQPVLVTSIVIVFGDVNEILVHL